MKKICFPIFLILCIANAVCAQISSQPATRRNCSFVGSPILDIGGGLVNGKAIKLPSPHLSGKAKKLARNTVIAVKVEVDESGKVSSAKADTENNLLKEPLENAALAARFSPTVADGVAVKVKGMIIYERRNGKTYVSDRLEPIEYKPVTIPYDAFKRMQTFDSKILSVIADFKSGKPDSSVNFIKNGQVNIQICLGTKTPEIVDRIKQTGFELLEETQGDGLVGRIAVGNLEKLTDIEEIRFVVPEIQ